MRLEDDPFFGERVVLAVRRCLSSSENLNIISPVELRITRQAPLVRKLNRELNGELLEQLYKWRASMTPANALDLLLDATREGVIPPVVDLLDTAVHLEMTLDLEGAYSTLEKAHEENIPASWALQILGDEVTMKASENEERKPFSIGPL